MIEIKVDISGLEDLINEVTEKVKTIPRRIGNEMVNYSKKSFNKKEWDSVRWPNKYGKSHLLVASGILRRSIRLDKYDEYGCTIISDTEYSEIHNSGGKIEDKNGNMQKFCWAKWYETQDDNWKWTALKLKKDGFIEIEKTQFLGESNELIENIEQMLLKMIENENVW